MSTFGRREKRSIDVSDFGAALKVARATFRAAEHLEAIDIYEQLISAYPQQAIELLGELYDQYQSLPESDSRYYLYQARHFDFGIEDGDKVLDIGSGNIPFPFATHLGEIAVHDNNFGRAGEPFKYIEGKPVFECSIEEMPFEDKEFDFVYCSHVLEHVDDPEKACTELMRVGKKGYIEAPTRGKDLWLDAARISNHRWALEHFNDVLIFTEYSQRDLDGLRSDILMKMHCAPETLREKAFSAIIYLKAELINTIFLWEGEFSYQVRRIEKK